MTDSTTVQLWFSHERQRDFAFRALDSLIWWLVRRRDTIAGALPWRWEPPEIQEAIRIASNAKNALGRHAVGVPGGSVFGVATACELAANDLPILRLALEHYIESCVQLQESTARLSHLQDPQKALLDDIESGQSILQLPPLVQVQPAGPFSLAEYLNLETISKLDVHQGKLRERVYDSKFHILMEHTLFLDDLRYFREQCGMRERSVSVAYIDIDNFGALNRSLPGKETQVDRDVLPRFMSALERYVFARGFAYREGGDEYIVLLPNVAHLDALNFFDDLREFVAALTYPVEMTAPTVSIGVCTATAADRLTPLQVQSLANKAKAHAKSGGKNRVAGYREGSQPCDAALFIFERTAATVQRY